MQTPKVSAQVPPAEGWHAPRDLHLKQATQMQGTQSAPGPDSPQDTDSPQGRVSLPSPAPAPLWPQQNWAANMGSG